MAELLALADDETRAMWDGLRLGYTESTGHPLLRAEIAELYETLEPDDVLVFAGAEEAIFCLMNVLLGPGDHVVCTWPGYQSLYEVARAAGAKVSLHALREEDGWGLDVERLRRAILPRRSSSSSTRPTTRRACCRAPRSGRASSTPAPTAASPPGRRGLPLPGIRRGGPTAAGADAIRARRLARRHVEVVRDGRTPDRLAREPRSGVARTLRDVQGLHDDLLIGAVRDPRPHRPAGPRRGAGPIAADRRDEPGLLDDFFERRAERFTWVRPRAGSVGVPAAPPRRRRSTASPPSWWRQRASCSCPGSPFGSGGDHFRLGFGRENLPEALARLEAFLDRAT